MRIKNLKVKVENIREVKKDIFLLSFTSPYLAKASLPGNFLHLKIKNTILRRPFSIFKVEKNRVYILFKLRGRGTRNLSGYRRGEVLDIIAPLGNSFKIKPTTNHQLPTTIIFIAAGIGVAGLYFLALRTKDQGPKTKDLVLLGAKTKKDIVFEREFREMGYKVLIATEDGSKGFKGKVTELLERFLRGRREKGEGTIYACGPKEMFTEMKRILKPYPQMNCYVSFEQFMGCGLGICCACVIETKSGYKKVCQDGAVFNLNDI